MTTLSTQLLVIGAGATGLGVAWDACLRGLKVVVLEQDDLGQGTSGRFHGLLHSGGRYVVSDPSSARDCAHENRILRRIAAQTIEETGGLFVSAPADPAAFADRWAAACVECGVAAQELPLSELRRIEPLLNPRLHRAFRVDDAAIDSFDLLHALAQAVRAAGGRVLVRQRLDRLHLEGGRVRSAGVTDLRTGEQHTFGVEMVVNAAGPFAREVARLAGVRLPIALGRGAMVAMAARLVHTVVNRLKPPSDGDILVPVGTVSVLGTTDVRVERPTDHTIEPWEIDLLLGEGELLIPGLSRHRALRAWSGLRPLYRPETAAGQDTRALARAHHILDHQAMGGPAGLVSVIGGKLTTYRLMAEQTLDIAAPQLGNRTPCRTADTPLERATPAFYSLPERWRRLERASDPAPPEVVCECEMITRADLETALNSPDVAGLDDLRRDLRLGMGPCQGGFCAHRAQALAHRLGRTAPEDDWLAAFLDERWRGTRPLAWGHGLRQAELTRRLYGELLGSLAGEAEADR